MRTLWISAVLVACSGGSGRDGSDASTILDGTTWEVPPSGHVFALTGPFDEDADIDDLTSFNPRLDPGWGRAMARLGDVDGDGVPDLAIGGYERVVALSGADLAPEDAPRHVQWWEVKLGWADVGPAGDLDGDGLADAVIGNGAYVAIQLGRARDPAATLEDLDTGVLLPQPYVDTDGDGLPELVTAHLDPLELVVVPAADVVSWHDPSSAGWTRVAPSVPHAEQAALLVLDDADDDGFPEVLLAWTGGAETWTAAVVRGADLAAGGAVTAQWTPAWSGGVELVLIDDVDGDGVRDVAWRTQAPSNCAESFAWGVWSGAALVDGRDEALASGAGYGLSMYDDEVGSGDCHGPAMYGQLDAGDLDGDGILDLVISGPDALWVLGADLAAGAPVAYRATSGSWEERSRSDFPGRDMGGPALVLPPVVHGANARLLLGMPDFEAF